MNKNASPGTETLGSARGLHNLPVMYLWVFLVLGPTQGLSHIEPCALSLNYISSPNVWVFLIFKFCWSTD